MAVLVLAEHSNAALNDVTAKTVAAAQAFGGDIDVLVAGHNAGAAAQAAARLAGVRKVIHVEGEAFDHGIAEAIEALVVPMMGGYDAFFAQATSIGKNAAPRIAAKLDVMQVSDIVAVDSADTFVRPIYAGNALATVQSKDRRRVLMFR
jgi:electron transfer flavoprotein alpha subunit